MARGEAKSDTPAAPEPELIAEATEDDCAEPDPENRVFPERYHVVEAIGEGGLGRVYRAHDAVLGRTVALKMFRASATADDDLARQQAEIAVLAQLSHPNIVALHDAAIDRSDPDSPRIYYVMELVEGIDLKKLLTQEQLGPRQIAQLGYYVATALEHVHHHGIVHRDVKPANILLGGTGPDATRVTVKLGDFGLASVGPATPITERESISGTVAYLSPEQAQGELVATSTDVYSLGLVLLQCFTGRLAFPGNPIESALARLLDNPEIPADLPQDWRLLLSAMTARQPADRPDARDVALALRQMFAAESGRHRADESSPESAGLADIREALASFRGSLESVTRLAARITGSRVALVTLIDEDDAWIAACTGLESARPVLNGRALAAIIRSRAPAAASDWIAPDASSQDTAERCEVVPLVTRTGRVLGALCVIGGELGEASTDVTASLDDLAALIVGDLEVRIAAHRAANAEQTT